MPGGGPGSTTCSSCHPHGLPAIAGTILSAFFSDGLCRCSRRQRARQRGGVQWIFPPDAVVIKAIWLQSNAPPDADERRFVHWVPEREAIPPGKSLPTSMKKRKLIHALLYDPDSVSCHDNVVSVDTGRCRSQSRFPRSYTRSSAQEQSSTARGSSREMAR